MSPKYKYLAVIPNAIPPYGYEFVNILCLPTGFKSRFRFSEKWVSDEFKATYKDYIGMAAHIILRDKDSTDIFPLRKAIVDDILKIGDTYLIRYTLGSYFQYDSKDSERDKQIKKYREEFFAYHDEHLKDNLPSKDMKPLVFGSSFDFKFENNHFDAQEEKFKDLEIFHNIIESIKAIPFFESVTFTKIINLKEKNSSNVPSVVDGSYKVKEETDYEISIYQTTPTMKADEAQGPNDITISADTKYISIVRGKQRAVGKYDIINLLFRTNINSAGVNSFVDIIYQIKPGSERFVDPNISLPISIIVRFRGVIDRLLVFILALLLYYYSYILKAVGASFSGVIKDVSILAAAVVLFDFKNKFIDYLKRQ